MTFHQEEEILLNINNNENCYSDFDSEFQYMNEDMLPFQYLNDLTNYRTNELNQKSKLKNNLFQDNCSKFSLKNYSDIFFTISNLIIPMIIVSKKL